MKRNGLTISMLFEAESANYGEGFGNITVLKKLGRGDGKQYTYISRQAMRYNIVNQLGWDNTPVDGKSGVVQFDPNATIEQYPEIDLFGYLKTSAKPKDDEDKKEKKSKKEKGDGEEAKGGSQKRSAVVRLSNAIALESYQSDLDYLTNMGLAARGGLDNVIAQSEIHKSIYAYTITIDLDRIGVEVDNKGVVTVEVANKEKAKRVSDFLDVLQFLYRDIKGRRENLSPIFAVGGVYARKNPYFENRLKLNRGKLDVALLSSIIESAADVKDNTTVACLPGMLANASEVQEKLQPKLMGDLFAKLKAEVDAYYE